MVNAFERLGLPPRLVISEEELREAFRSAGKETHPDAGGTDGEFAALQQAFGILASPSQRLQHWLEIHGNPVETRGTIHPAIMDLFSEVGTVTQRAEALIRKRDEAKSALVKAMLENETQGCLEALEEAVAKVESWIQRECAIFPDLEQNGIRDPRVFAETARNLVFLEKWKATLRSLFSRLV
jgi:hypothetical protein